MTSVSLPDIEYFLEPIILYVEGYLFRIPREYLVQASPLFLDMLHLPQPSTDDGSIGEGTEDASPLVLPETVKVAAFRPLIKLLFPSDFNVSLNKDEWLDVLELAEMWDMDKIRTRAIEQLRSLLQDDPTFRLHLARKYHVDEWMRPAAEGLIRRSAPLGKREFELLDQETLLKLAAIRERCYPVFYDSDYRYGTYSSPNASIGHWEIRGERSEVPVDLSTFTFTCPVGTSMQSADGEVLETEGPQKDGEFYFEKVVFRVEDQVFKVPSQPFAQHSSKFRQTFKERGFSKYDHHDPLVIKDVTAADFRSVLRLFFPPQQVLVHFLLKLRGEYEPKPEEWASILRLSAKWDMTEVKELAVGKLQNTNFGNVKTKLEMGKELGVQEWFSSGVKELITRSSPLTAPECQVLAQQELIQQILDLRERAHRRTFLCAYGHYEINHLRSGREELPNTCDISACVASTL